MFCNKLLTAKNVFSLTAEAKVYLKGGVADARSVVLDDNPLQPKVLQLNGNKPCPGIDAVPTERHTQMWWVLLTPLQSTDR